MYEKGYEQPLRTQRIEVYPATTKITLSDTSISLGMNASKDIKTTKTLSVTAKEPAYALGEYKYSSSNTKIATVDPISGKIDAVSPGKATIKVTAQDGTGKSASCAVTVVAPVTSVYIRSPYDDHQVKYTGDSTYYYPIMKGKSITFNVGILPVNATNQKLKWETGDPKLVSVSNTGKVTAKGTYMSGNTFIGTTWVKATTTDGTNLSKTFYVSVYDGPLSAIKPRVYIGDKPASYNYYSSYKEAIPPKVSLTKDGNIAYVTCAFYVPLAYLFTADIYATSMMISSSNVAVAEVIGIGNLSDGRAFYKIKLNQKGTAKITMKTVDGTNKTATLTLTVVE